MVELAVEGQDQRRVVGDPQGGGRDIDALRLDALDLVDEMPGIDDDAVADHRELAAADHAGGQQRQLVRHSVDDQRVPGIVAALKTDHDVGLLGEPVDDLALALVAPLGAYNDDVGHACLLTRDGNRDGAARGRGLRTS